jgi:hypothetical protein
VMGHKGPQKLVRYLRTRQVRSLPSAEAQGGGNEGDWGGGLGYLRGKQGTRPHRPRFADATACCEMGRDTLALGPSVTRTPASGVALTGQWAASPDS